MLQWHLSRGVVVIPKTSNPGRLGENINCNDFRLTKAEIESIKELNCGQRVYDTRAFGPPYDAPFFP